MTIFDVLRYDISRPPTKAQLNALPPPVYASWCKAIGFNSLIPEKGFMVGLLHMKDDDTGGIPDNEEIYESLTQILLEYKDDDI